MKSLIAIFLISFPFSAARAPIVSQDAANNTAKKINYCEIVAAPRNFDKSVMDTIVILDETNGSPDVYGATCPPLASRDNRAQAVLPAGWQGTPEGTNLQSLLRRKHKAQIEIVGTFKSTGGPFGPSVAPFRLTITRIISAAEVQKSGRT